MRAEQSPPRMPFGHLDSPSELFGIPYSRLNRGRRVPTPAHRLNTTCLLTVVNRITMVEMRRCAEACDGFRLRAGHFNAVFLSRRCEILLGAVGALCYYPGG